MNQKIKGYRELNDAETQLINIIKGKADDLDVFICGLENKDHTPPRPIGVPESGRPEVNPNSVDARELAQARTKFQEGFMHLVRAIAQPGSL